MKVKTALNFVCVFVLLGYADIAFAQGLRTEYNFGETAPPKTFTVKAGTSLGVRLTAELSTKKNKNGEVVSFVTTELIYINKTWAVPAGLRVEGRLLKSKRPGRIHGKARVVVKIEKLYLDEKVFVPFPVSVLGNVSPGVASFWYRPFGKSPEVKSGSLILVGRSSVSEDLKEIARGTFVFGGVTTLLKRGSDLAIDAGTPFAFTLGTDMEIPTESIPLVEIMPLCPCPSDAVKQKEEQ